MINSFGGMRRSSTPFGMNRPRGNGMGGYGGSVSIGQPAGGGLGARLGGYGVGNGRPGFGGGGFQQGNPIARVNPGGATSLPGGGMQPSHPIAGIGNPTAQRPGMPDGNVALGRPGDYNPSPGGWGNGSIAQTDHQTLGGSVGGSMGGPGSSGLPSYYAGDALPPGGGMSEPPGTWSNPGMGDVANMPNLYDNMHDMNLYGDNGKPPGFGQSIASAGAIQGYGPPPANFPSAPPQNRWRSSMPSLLAGVYGNPYARGM